MCHSQVLLLLGLPRRTRRASRAVIRELRGIFAAILSEIFDGYFENCPWIFMTRGYSGETGTAPTGSGQGCNQP
jgi:hypothetical protein